MSAPLLAHTPSDALPVIRVEVTGNIIRDSRRRDSSHCLIAEATKAAYPDATHVLVDLQTIRFTDKKRGLRFTYLTPRTVQVAIIDFDQGTLPKPFSFRLDGDNLWSRKWNRTRAARRARAAKAEVSE